MKEKSRGKVGWGVKLVERPGSPLAMIFVKKEPMKLGCPLRDKCIICENEGVKCNKKKVVYLGECLTCEEMKHKLDEMGQDDDTCYDSAREFYNQGTYVGETSRLV